MIRLFVVGNQAADQAFFAWLTQHPAGYVINENGFLLHRASCHHLTDTSTPRITLAPKYCSEDDAELRAYADARKQELEPCGDCQVHA